MSGRVAMLLASLAVTACAGARGRNVRVPIGDDRSRELLVAPVETPPPPLELEKRLARADAEASARGVVRRVSGNRLELEPAGQGPAVFDVGPGVAVFLPDELAGVEALQRGAEVRVHYRGGDEGARALSVEVVAPAPRPQPATTGEPALP